MKSFIRNLSAPAEFLLVIFVCFWWGIGASIRALVSRSSGVNSAPAFTDSGALMLAILELSSLAVAFWIARIRGWSFRSFGLQPGWRSTGTGILVLIALVSVRYAGAVLVNAISPGSVRLLPVASHVSVPLLILTL